MGNLMMWAEPHILKGLAIICVPLYLQEVNYLKRSVIFGLDNDIEKERPELQLPHEIMIVDRIAQSYQKMGHQESKYLSL